MYRLYQPDGTELEYVEIAFNGVSQKFDTETLPCSAVAPNNQPHTKHTRAKTHARTTHSSTWQSTLEYEYIHARARRFPSFLCVETTARTLECVRENVLQVPQICLLYTSPSPRDRG